MPPLTGLHPFAGDVLQICRAYGAFPERGSASRSTPEFQNVTVNSKRI
jgi:hypothetical protein